MTEKQTAVGRRRGGVIEWVGVAVLVAAGALAALLELFLVPLYSGSTLVPVTVLLAVAGNVLLPRLAKALVASTLAIVLPLLAWLFVVFVVGLTARPEGDVVLPGSGGAVWAGYGVLFGGVVAGIATAVITAPPRRLVSR